MRRLLSCFLCVCVLMIILVPTLADEGKKKTAYEAYKEAIDLKVDDLEVVNVQGIKIYFYKDFDLVYYDKQWVTDSLNKSKTVMQGAIYRSIAGWLYLCREGYYDALAKKSELVFGKKIEDKKELKPYVERMSRYFIDKGQVLPAVMKEFKTLKSVTGKYDFDNWKYEIKIPDLTECANELQISEETLGYLFAMLAEYTNKIDFKGNSCTIKYP